MFGKRRKKDLSTPADTHLKELCNKAYGARKLVENKAKSILKLQKAYDILPASPEKTVFKERIDRSKKELLLEFERYVTAKDDYEKYFVGTKDARVTTIGWKGTLPDIIEILYNLM